MENTKSLNAEEYNDFLRCLINIKEACNDVDIRDGVIRQRSNDKTSIFEINMSSILPNISMAISDIKRKLDAFKTFAGNEVTITTVDGDPGYFMFADSISVLKFISPSLQYIDNKFMSSEELDRLFTMNENDLLLEYDLSNLITNRVRTLTTNFNTDAIQVTFEGETASIRANTQAKDQFIKFVSDIQTNVIISESSALLPTIPFGVDHDNEVKFKMFKDPSQDISLNTFNTVIGDINMRILTRSSIVRNTD